MNELPDIPGFLHRPLRKIAESWPWLNSTINEIAINTLVNSCRARPHPWSTAHDYVSWVSLTDQRWHARHLPAYVNSAPLPDVPQVMALFHRPSGKQQLCSKSTCLFPAFAQYLTDGFLRTRMPRTGEDPGLRRQNTSNHQIDMCPLYGRTPDQTRALRLKSEQLGQRGQLRSQQLGTGEYAPFYYNDDGTEKTEFKGILDPPLGVPDDPRVRSTVFAFGGDRSNAVPQVAMLNTLFLREHNRVAAAIEREHPGWSDDRVFETTRNCIIVLFIKIVVEDYINHISNSPFRFRAEPRLAWDASWNKANWVTAEFSLLYRWHSLVPETMRWGEQSYTIPETVFNNRLLIDAGLGRSFVDVSAQPAGRLGAFNTSAALLHLEQFAIEQGRLVNLAPYVNYRKYSSLRVPTSFEEVSDDRRVHDVLRTAYQRVEDVEFYPGLFAEVPVSNSPLPPLMQRMVAVDAFSQALTNPLLSKHVFNRDTFSKTGWDIVNEDVTLGDVVRRNADVAEPITMTRSDWRPA